MDYKKFSRISPHVAMDIMTEELEDSHIEEVKEDTMIVIIDFSCDFFEEEEILCDFVDSFEDEDDFPAFPAHSKQRGRAWRRHQDRRTKANLAYKAEIAMSRDVSSDCWYTNSKQAQYLRNRHKVPKGHRLHKGSKSYKAEELIKCATKMKLVDIA